MGGVSVESGGGGRKSVDSNVNMVPMIDLLISVIAFLLMTAVWVQTGQLQASQPRGAPSPDSQPPENPQQQIKIFIRSNDIVVGNSVTDGVTINNGPRRLDDLRERLRERHNNAAQQREVWIQPDGTVSYNDIIEVMDVVYEIWGDNRPPGTQIRDMVTIRFL